MEQFILDHPVLVWRWSVPLLVTFIVGSGAFALAVLRWKSLKPRRWTRRMGLAVLMLTTIAAAGGLFLRLGPLQPFVRTIGELAEMKGKSVPDIELVRVHDAVPLHLEQFRGKVVVLNLWGTWCPPCRAEMPDLVRLAETERERLVVVTISDEDLETQRRFAELVGLPTEAAMGDIGWDAATFRPFTIIVDQEGIVRDFHFGAGDYDFFMKRVEQYL